MLLNHWNCPCMYSLFGAGNRPGLKQCLIGTEQYPRSGCFSTKTEAAAHLAVATAPVLFMILNFKMKLFFGLLAHKVHFFLKIRQKNFFGYLLCCGPTIYATKRASFDDLEPTISAISFKKQTQCKRKGPTIYATRNRRFYICLPLIQAVLSNKIGGFVIRRRTLHSLSRGNP